MAGLALSVIILVAAWDCWVPVAAKESSYAEVTLTALSEKSPASNATEVWITEVTNQGSVYDLTKIDLEKTGWEMKSGRILFNRSEPASLKIRLYDPSSPAIRILTHPWSGKLRIQEGKKDTTLDLYAPAETTFLYHITDPSAFYHSAPWPVHNIVLIYLCAFLIIAMITLGIVWLPGKSAAIAGAMSWAALIIFLYSNNFLLHRDERWELIILSVIIGWWAGKGFADGAISAFSKYQKLGLWLIAIYAAFASAGTALFLFSPIEPIGIPAVACYLLIVLWWWVTAIAFIYATIRLSRHIMDKNGTHTGEEVKESGIWWKFFLIPFLTWCLWLVTFYPGILSDDSHVQWAIATGTKQWNDWHPVLHTLFNKLALLVWKNPASPVLLQIIFMSVIVSRFGCFLYRRGVSKKALYILITAFAVMPNNGILMVTLWKDIPFAAAVLWLNLVIIKLLCNDYQKKYAVVPDLAISLFFTSLFRHNGIIIFVFCLAGLLFYVWKYRNLAVLAGLALSVVMIFSFKTFFVNTPYVIGNPASIKLVPPAKGIAAVMKYNGKLPADAAFMDTILPHQEWLDKYNPYSPDLYMFKTKWVMLNKLDFVPAEKVIKTYLECFKDNPRLIIWDKLLGSSIAWNVSQPEYVTFRYLTHIVRNDNGLESHSWKGGVEMAKKYLRLSEHDGLVTILWRVGLANILLLVLAVYMSGRNVKFSWIMFLPWLAGVLSLVIASLEQDFRFVYFVFVSFWFQWFFIMTTKKKESDAKE
ncbi:DUF6020 family protein [Pseudobacter ginsenosidimutans]|uniref:DUF6020 family protein n=1 Tax=Pseudobacter ginsenosidimutans TaxID=661488 RepID=UPI00102D7637|nr:DUF6020 family protein [Pseudobacter ginsenosidimutans]QEC42200.1 hypothetical protein FSB84_11050 [Pseudobacter ginsenosidimutans]